MHWLIELFQDIPLSAVLREKVSLIEANFQTAETKIASLELENANLTERVTILEGDKAKLEKQVKELSHVDDLHEIEIQIIKLLTQNPETNEAAIQNSLNVPYATAVNHVARLKDLRYIHSVKVGVTDFPRYALSKKGREFAHDSRLV